MEPLNGLPEEVWLHEILLARISVLDCWQVAQTSRAYYALITKQVSYARAMDRLGALADAQPTTWIFTQQTLYVLFTARVMGRICSCHTFPATHVKLREFAMGRARRYHYWRAELVLCNGTVVFLQMDQRRHYKFLIGTHFRDIGVMSAFFRMRLELIERLFTLNTS